MRTSATASRSRVVRRSGRDAGAGTVRVLAVPADRAGRATNLLTFGALAGREPVGSDAYVQLGILLALMVDAVRVLIGLARSGGVAHLMSEPMLMGFMPVGTIITVASQLPSALGVKADPDDSVPAAADPGAGEAAAAALSLDPPFDGVFRRVS